MPTVIEMEYFKAVIRAANDVGRIAYQLERLADLLQAEQDIANMAVLTEGEGD